MLHSFNGASFGAGPKGHGRENRVQFSPDALLYRGSIILVMPGLEPGIHVF
ncbi:hypothetical protein [Microvirga sp. TS319]|uniref:hypothetical protein n=1 Tax=Microvirga sp. TS319 TaxID=3241165 RepID=UPI003519DD56